MLPKFATKRVRALADRDDFAGIDVAQHATGWHVTIRRRLRDGNESRALVGWDRDEINAYRLAREAMQIAGLPMHASRPKPVTPLSGREVARVRSLSAGEVDEWAAGLDEGLFAKGWIETDGRHVTAVDDALDILFDSHGRLREGIRETAAA